MVKEKRLNRTTMYSIAENNGEVIVHHLPFDSQDKIGRQKLKRYEDMGYMYEDPRGAVNVNLLPKEVGAFTCECGKECKSAWGLEVHKRSHDKVIAVK